MKKIYFLTSLLTTIITLPIFAKPLSPEEALSRLNNTAAPIKMPAKSNFSTAFTIKDKASQPTVYVFNRGDDDGFIVMSADDSALPVLGYSDSGSFNPDNIAPELAFWLNEYGRQIDYMRERNYPVAKTGERVPFSGYEEIEPLMKSKWNQGSPYNDYCYTIAANGEQTKSVTGCVATSMAQVMYYFKYPETGHGEISYKHGDSGTYSMNFGEKSFDWDEMLPTYYPGSYTETQADAVAYLMKACGYSVRMDYGKGESGASGTAIAGALIDYFGYNEGINVQTRAFRTYDEWAQMIYDNLKNIGPVVYNGSALDGGHSFVCDGYDGNGYFHFNWGWGGMSDGFYLLDALNPDEFGIGGAAGGFNLGQQIILGISPESTSSEIPSLMQFGTATGSIDGSTLTIKLEKADNPGFQYINPTTINVTFGVKIVNSDRPEDNPQYIESEKKNLSAEQGTFFRWNEVGTAIDLSALQMSDGVSYDFILATNIKYENRQGWTETVAVPGKWNYISVTKHGSGYEVKEFPVENLTVSNLKILSDPVYLDSPIKFSAGFSNDGSEQLTRNYSAVFFDAEGQECYKMENYSVNVDPNNSITSEWTSVQWYKESAATDITEPTEFTLKLYDNWEGTYVELPEQKVTIQPRRNDEAKIESELTIIGAEKDGDIYIINGTEIQVSLTVKVVEGFFNHTLMLALQMPLDNDDYYTIMHKHFDAIPDLAAGEEQVFNMSMTFDDPDPNKIYRVEVWGPDSGFNEKVLVRFNTDENGIESIKPDSDGLYRIYNLNGTLCLRSYDKSVINDLPSGFYIINGKKFIK